MAKPSIQNTNTELLSALTSTPEEQASAGFGVSQQLPEALNEPIAAYLEAPTAATARGITTAIQQDTTGTLQNQFIGALLQMTSPYVQKARAWNNKLEQFMKDETFGQNIEEIAVNLFNSKVYKTGKDNKDPMAAFKQNVPDVRSKIHTVNFEKYWPATINDAMISRAFMGEYGLSNLLTTINTQLTTSAKFAEYEAFMSEIISQYKKGKIRGETIKNPTTKEDIENLSVRIRTIINNFQTPSTNYNKSELQTFTPLDDIITLVTSDTEANLVKRLLANAYNLELGELEGKVIVVPEFEGVGIEVLIADRESFISYKKLQRTTTLTDPVHLNTNVFLHVHDLFAFSEFTNAYVFTTDVLNEQGVTQLTVSSSTDTVQRGQTLQMNAAVTGDSSNLVYWFVEGASAESTTDITNTGLLRVDADDPVGEKLKVVAYSKKNSEISGSKTVTVTA